MKKYLYLLVLSLTLVAMTYARDINQRSSFLSSRSNDLIEFSDIKGHRYEDSVTYLQRLGVVKGYPDGSFGVDRSISRAEMMKIVFEASQDAVGEGSHCFNDVGDEWYAPYICYAASHRIVKGIGNGLFGPNNSVTIAEGVKIAVNVFAPREVVEGQGSQRYQPYFDRVSQQGIFALGELQADQHMTRGQMSYLVHRLVIGPRSSQSSSNTSAAQNDLDDIYKGGSGPVVSGKVKSSTKNNTSASSGDSKQDIPSSTKKSGAISSPGCGLPPPSAVMNQFVVEGVTRNTIVDLPSRYDNNTAHKLVIAWHGRTNSNAQVRGYLGLAKTVDSSTIVVYPLALPEGGPSRSWSTTTDVTFFDTIVKELSQVYCIDQSQIYVIGHSLGGWFANTLACMRGNVIAGLGSVGGSVTRKDCNGSVPAMIMHHPDDNLASYAGGVGARDLYLEQNGCDANSATAYPGSAANSNCVQYQCSGAPVVRCAHSETNTWGYYYPHTWPSFATKMIWDFWQKN